MSRKDIFSVVTKGYPLVRLKLIWVSSQIFKTEHFHDKYLEKKLCCEASFHMAPVHQKEIALYDKVLFKGNFYVSVSGKPLSVHILV